jgi:hypothetical protein
LKEGEGKMSDYWMELYATNRHAEFQKEAQRVRLIYLAKGWAKPGPKRQSALGALLHRLGRGIESWGSSLRKRFAPPAGDEHACCAKAR